MNYDNTEGVLPFFAECVNKEQHHCHHDQPVGVADAYRHGFVDAGNNKKSCQREEKHID